MRAIQTSLSGLQLSRNLGCQVAENEFKVSCEPLKHCFLDFTQVTFWAREQKENEFPVPGEHLKHRFLDLIKVKLWACQQAENDL